MITLRRAYWFLCFGLCFGVYVVKAQPDTVNQSSAAFSLLEISWAESVVSFSSEYSTTLKSARQVLGKPSVVTGTGSSPLAWTIKKKSSEGVEFLRVRFGKAMEAQQIAVAENYRPGAIEKITLYGKNRGEEIVVYDKPADAPKESERMFHVFFPQTPFAVAEAELRFNSKKIADFEIDAIAVSNSKEPVTARINMPGNLKYPAEKESLGPNVNSKYDERVMLISADGTELYFDRKYHPSNMGGGEDEDDIWYSKYEEGKGWSFAYNVGKPLNNKSNNFAQSMSPDGNMMLVANVYKRNGYDVIMEPGVSVSVKTKEGWSFPVGQRIKDFRNKSPYANYFMTADGKNLIMAIEGEDSQGGLDLYVSFRTDENSWSKPVSLGPDVNTAVNDYSPFMAADGVTLYYSTSGILGFGKEDVFVTRRMDDTWKKWSEPMNMGPPINTKESDTKFSVPATGNYAYFTSNIGPDGLNDIFRVLLPDIMKPRPVALLRGKVLDFNSRMPVGKAVVTYKSIPDGQTVVSELSDSLTGAFSIYIPIGLDYNATVTAPGYVDGEQKLELAAISSFTIIEQQPILMVPKKEFKTISGRLSDKLTDTSIDNAKVSITTDAEGKNVIAVTYTDENGVFEIKVENVDDTEQLYLSIEKEDYEQIILPIDDTFYETDLPMDLVLIPEIKQDAVIEFHNVYFDPGSAVLKDSSTFELDLIVDVMKKNPGMIIELSGHTDSKSSSDFNMQLSLQRAESAKDYIVKKGIQADRIQAAGYGESRLLNHCSDGVECSEQEHALNRRIEIKIIKM